MNTTKSGVGVGVEFDKTARVGVELEWYNPGVAHLCVVETIASTI